MIIYRGHTIAIVIVCGNNVGYEINSIQHRESRFGFNCAYNCLVAAEKMVDYLLLHPRIAANEWEGAR